MGGTDTKRYLKNHLIWTGRQEESKAKHKLKQFFTLQEKKTRKLQTLQKLVFEVAQTS